MANKMKGSEIKK